MAFSEASSSGWAKWLLRLAIGMVAAQLHTKWLDVVAWSRLEVDLEIAIVGLVSDLACLLNLTHGIGVWRVPEMLLMYSKAARLFGITGNVRKRKRTSSSFLAATDRNRSAKQSAISNNLCSFANLLTTSIWGEPGRTCRRNVQ